MSRVRKPRDKFMNRTHYDHSVTNTSPIRRYKSDHVDYTKAESLSTWLFLKYDMSYKTYRNKSKPRRDILRREYTEDTGKELRTFEQSQKTDEDSEDDEP